MTTQNFLIQDITLNVSQQRDDVEPEIVLYDYRPNQKDTYFSGRENLLKLRAAVDFALNDKPE